jgi:hypothetical protein
MNAFCFVTIILKYGNFTKFSKDLLAVSNCDFVLQFGGERSRIA